MNVLTSEAITGTWQVIQALYKRVEGEAKDESAKYFSHFARLLPVLEELKTTQAKLFRKMSYEQGLSFQNAIIEGKIQFEWPEGRDNPEKYSFDGAFVANLKNEDKEWLFPLLNAIIAKAK